jgi:hypothetical protein
MKLNSSDSYFDGKYISEVLQNKSKTNVNDALRQRYVDFYKKPKDQYIVCGVREMIQIHID